MRLKTYLLSGIALTAVSLSMPAFAQLGPAGEIPGAAESSRVEQGIRKPDFDRNVQTEIRVPELRIEGAPDGADKIKLKLNSISFEGVTAYNDEELRSVYGASIGEVISLTDFYGIAEQIMRKYRNDGYIISQVVVPEQTIDGGNAKLMVVEGYIDQVNIITDNETRDLAQIKQIAQNITNEKPLTATALERYLLIINDLPGVTARSIISPSQEVVGAADIDIVVERENREYLLGVDNFGSRYLGAMQLTAAAQYLNPFQLNERWTFQGVTAPYDHELFYGFSSVELPVSDEGTILTLDGSYSKTRPGFDLAIFDVEGEASRFGAELEHPFIRSRNENLNLRVSFDYLHQESSDAIFITTRTDDVRSLRVGGDYQSITTLLGNPGSNTFDFEVSKGLSALGATDDSSTFKSRPNGTAEYYKVNAQFERLQRLTPVFNILFGVKGQYTDQELLSSEEFGLGGLDYGRGYDASEVVGDRGYAGKVELQANNIFPNSNVTDYQLYAFYDWGRVWDDDATANSEKTNSIASAGIGTRTDFTPDLSGDLYVAFPLTRDVQTNRDEDPRVFAGIRKRF